MKRGSRGNDDDGRGGVVEGVGEGEVEGGVEPRYDVIYEQSLWAKTLNLSFGSFLCSHDLLN